MINLVNTPPRVSIPRESGVTSNKRTSLTLPRSTPPWTTTGSAPRRSHDGTSEGLTNDQQRLQTFHHHHSPASYRVSNHSRSVDSTRLGLRQSPQWKGGSAGGGRYLTRSATSTSKHSDHSGGLSRPLQHSSRDPTIVWRQLPYYPSRRSLWKPHLDGSPHGDDLIGVDPPRRRLTEERLHLSLDLGHPRHAPHQENFVDVTRLPAISTKDSRRRGILTVSPQQNIIFPVRPRKLTQRYSPRHSRGNNRKSS